MKKIFSGILLCLILFAISACGTGNQALSDSIASKASPSEMEQSSSVEQSGSAESSAPPTDAEEPERTSRQIAVQFGENTVVYELNNGTAADSFYAQLPLTIEVENYSTNEKIFYPKQPLDTSNSPLAQAGAGTHAYYEPWGDMVFFYGDYNENPSLFELGQVIAGGELVSEMSGTITIKAVK